MDGAADVAETTYTPFQSEPGAAPVRLIVQRVKPAPGSQLALFATYSYHGFITGREGELLELEADHRRHAGIENAIRNLKYGGVGLNHLPSGRFAANGAWLAAQVMAHNLARWTARVGLGEQTRDHEDPPAAVLRPGGTDHPLRAPVDPASSQALAVGGEGQSRPGPAASHSTPSLTAPGSQFSSLSSCGWYTIPPPQWCTFSPPLTYIRSSCLSSWSGRCVRSRAP